MARDLYQFWITENAYIINNNRRRVTRKYYIVPLGNLSLQLTLFQKWIRIFAKNKDSPLGRSYLRIKFAVHL